MWRFRQAIRAHFNVPADQMQGGNNGTQQQPANGQQQQKKDISQDNLTLTPAFWNNDQSVAVPDANKPASAQQPNGQQQQQQGGTPNVADYIKGLKLTREIDLRAVGEKLQNGDATALQPILDQFGSNMYQSMMVDFNRLLDLKINQTLEKSIATSRTEFQDNMAQQQLSEALPFTSDPLVRPLAIQIFKQALSKKQTIDQAIKTVGDYFSHTMKVAGKDLSRNDSRRQGTGFGNTPPMGGNGSMQDEEQPDWLDMLTQAP